MSATTAAAAAAPPMDTPLDVRREGAVLLLTLNDPATRNTLQPPVYEKGLAALRGAVGDGVRAVVISGAGGTFCSGGDLRRLNDPASTSDKRRASLAAFHGFIAALRSTPLPVIAAVEGAAAGAGFSIALACDLIVAAEDARFVMAYVKVGLNPDGGASALLSRGLPHQLVSELLFTGEPVTTGRLRALGVVNRVAEPGHALADALTWAGQLARGPRAALGRAKTLVEGARHNGLVDQLDLEAELFVAATDHPESAEGMSAFLGKRRPAYDTL